jgi:hypothetical protein
LDFNALQTAFDIAVNGENPYFSEVAYEVELLSRDGKPVEVSMSFELPPWTLVLFSPAHLLPAKFALAVLLLAQLACLAYLVHTVADDHLIFPALAVLFFAPHLEVINEIQFGIYFATTITLLLRALESQRWILSGFLFFFLTIKGVRFFPFAFGLSVWLIHKRDLRPLFAGAAWSVCFVLITELVFPGIVQQWLAHLPLVKKKLVELETLSPMRLVWRQLDIPFSETVYAAIWLSVCVLTGTLAYVFRRVSISLLAIPLLAVTICLSNYLWLHDCAVFVLVQMRCFRAMRESLPKANILFFCSIIAQFLVLLQKSIGGVSLWQLAWYPLVMTLIAITLFRIELRDDVDSSKAV